MGGKVGVKCTKCEQLGGGRPAMGGKVGVKRARCESVGGGGQPWDAK